MNKTVIALSVLCIPLSLKASSTLKLMGPLWLLAVLWNNTLVGHAQLNYSPLQAHLASILVTLTFGLLANQQVRKVLQHPHHRWWTIPKRARVQAASTLRAITGHEISTRTHDLSKSGVFISLKNPTIRSSQPELYDEHWTEFTKPGTRCQIQIQIDSLNSINCTGEIVRQSTKTNTHPEGLGIKFIDLSREHSKIIEDLVHRAPMTSASTPINQLAA